VKGQMKKQYRQGDVLLIRIAKGELPTQCKTVQPQGGRHVLASGEATGHHHSVTASSTTALLAGPNEQMFFLVREGEALLEHQEHDLCKLPKGNYRVIIQREYSPQNIRRVQD
jgi:hypothetical protein